MKTGKERFEEGARKLFTLFFMCLIALLLGAFASFMVGACVKANLWMWGR